MATCICGSLGIYSFPLIERKFCVECFLDRFERRVLSTIPRSVRGKSIAIALSGGKDSSTVLHILSKFRKKLRLKKVNAITLRQEIPEVQEQQDDTVNKLKHDYPAICFVQKSYTELFGFDLPSLVEESDAKRLNFTPCAICGILKRHGIIRLALDLKVDYIVYGTTLEDEVGTILLNLFRNQLQRNYRNLTTYSINDDVLLPQRLKPLSFLSERTIMTYIQLLELPFNKTVCPYKNRSLRSIITPFLTSLGNINPHTLTNTIKSFSKGKESEKKEIVVQKCINCGTYSRTLVCSACKTIRQITS
ncbi:MAG: ATP-binding protein [Candidatus Hodarchaeales archaeon]